MKKNLIEWNINTYGRLSEKKKLICDDIRILDNKLNEDGVLMPDLEIKKKDLLANMEVILRFEDIHWTQKTKCKWIKKGDGNTIFFPQGG